MNWAPSRHFIQFSEGLPACGVRRIFEKINDRWEVCVSLSEGQSLQQVSLRFPILAQAINSIAEGNLGQPGE